MQEVRNFRDLGGIKANNGKTIKNGLFFRSAMLNDATDSDIQKLKALKIEQIFDYRDTDEIKLLVNDPYKKLGVKHLNYPVSLKNKKLLKLKKSSFFSIFCKKVTLEDIKESYRYLPFDNQGYKAMVEALKNDEVPIYQHCTAGKDRAGIGSALLLAILGASYDEILKDYLKSIDIKKYLQERLANFIPRFIRRFFLKRFELLFTVDKALLDASIDAINERYGSFEKYLFEEYQLDTKQLQQIRDKYTE